MKGWIHDRNGRKGSDPYWYERYYAIESAVDAEVYEGNKFDCTALYMSTEGWEFLEYLSGLNDDHSLAIDAIADGKTLSVEEECAKYNSYLMSHNNLYDPAIEAACK